jgi:hypothetical protein
MDAGTTWIQGENGSVDFFYFYFRVDDSVACWTVFRWALKSTNACPDETDALSMAHRVQHR